MPSDVPRPVNPETGAVGDAQMPVAVLGASRVKAALTSDIQSK
jgi:hypothetical protein